MDKEIDFKVLRNLIKFNTINDNENSEIINYIENYLKSYGFKTEYKSKNLVMSYGENQKLGFLGHTDTIECSSDFITPFDLREDGNHLYGLGVCDMKGGIAAFLDAISKIDFKELKSGIKVFFTYDEEIDLAGIKELVENKTTFPEYMIFGEPTNNEILVGQKGLLEYEIDFEGKRAHSSTPDKGISANWNAIKFLYELKDFYNNEIKPDMVMEFEVPYTTMNIGMINGGTSINSVSAFCKVKMDFRISKKEHIEKIMKKVEELSESSNARVKVLQVIEPFSDDIDFIKEKKTTNFLTEAAMVNGAKRMILGTGPVTAHEVNESITIESYNKLVNQYIDLINRICK